MRRVGGEVRGRVGGKVGGLNAGSKGVLSIGNDDDGEEEMGESDQGMDTTDESDDGSNFLAIDAADRISSPQNRSISTDKRQMRFQVKM